MLALIVETMLSALRFTLKWHGRKRNEHIVDDQDDIGPLMSDDIPVAMIELLGVLRMYTRVSKNAVFGLNLLPGFWTW